MALFCGALAERRNIITAPIAPLPKHLNHFLIRNLRKICVMFAYCAKIDGCFQAHHVICIGPYLLRRIR